MDKNEFERIKAEEKAHLRQLRNLKSQHRDAKRKASIMGALQGMTSPKQDAVHDEFTGKLATDAAMTEARFEIAAEEAERATQAEADAETTRQSEAEALIRQMKAELGGGDAPPTPPASGSGPETSGRRSSERSAAADGKTIGRTPPEADAPENTEADRGAKSIGRRRG